MTDLTEVTIDMFGRADVSGALADRLGSISPAAVMAAAEVAVPLVVQAIRHRVADPAGASELSRVVANIDPSELGDPVTVFRAGRDVFAGSQLVDHLFVDANARSQAARAVTEGAGLEPGTGNELLAAAAWAVGADLHQRAGSPVDGVALAAAVDSQADRHLPPAPATTLAPVVAASDERTIAGSAPADVGIGGGSPRVDAAFVGDPGGSAGRRPVVGLDTPPETVPARPRRPETRGSAEDDFSVGSSGLVTGVAALLALMVVGLGVWWWLDQRGEETVASVESTEAVTSADGDASTDDDAVADDDAGADDGTGDSGDTAAPVEESDPAEFESESESETGSTLIGPDGRAALVVDMLDPIGRSSATGSADLRFDPTTGEICYDLDLLGVAEPADGHIHLGPAGVKGGIVVDFGPMAKDASGCQSVASEQIDDILSDLDGHYVELHDPVEDFTIRAQLSEGIGPDGQPIAVPAGPDDDDDVAAEFDPDGGGAIAIVEPDRIVLRGEVADRQIAERVLVDFAGLSDVIVVDELTVDAGAPLPSGRVIIDSPGVALFATDSDVLDSSLDPLVDRLVALLEARPDWQITVVGHTDSTGNDVANLELSFRRAEAVRQELVDRGIGTDRIRVRGAGSTDPLASNDTLAGRAENRRIEFEIAR